MLRMLTPSKQAGSTYLPTLSDQNTKSPGGGELAMNPRARARACTWRSGWLGEEGGGCDGVLGFGGC